MNFARAIFAVSSLTMLSRIAGFIRDVITAALIGAGPVADAFFVAQRLPNLFRSLFAEGAFSASFVPLYTSEKQKRGVEEARRFAGEALSMMLVILTPFSILMILFMPWVMHALAPGFADEPEKYHLAVSLSQITFPYLLLVSLTALQGGVLNAHGKFAPPAAAPILFNLVMIAALLASPFLSLSIGYILAWSVTIAGIIQCAWLAWSCYHNGAAVPLRWPKYNERVKLLLKRIGPGALGAGAAQINLMVSTILASLLPTGAVSYLFYADRLHQLPLGVIGVAVATALLPILSHHLESNRPDQARHYFNRGIEFCLGMGIPASLGLIIAAEPIIQTLFERGAFTHEDTIATSQALAAYAVGIPAFLVVRIFAASFFAQHDTSTPVKVALISVAANILLSIILLPLLQHIGIALATGLATWLNCGLLYMRLRKKSDMRIDDRLKTRAKRFAGCALVMAVVLAALEYYLAPHFTTGNLWQEIAALVVLLGGGLLAYALMVHFTHAWRWQEIVAILKRREDTIPMAEPPTNG